MAPGKRTLTSRLAPLQARASRPLEATSEPADRGELVGPGHGSPVPPLGDVHAAADHGTSGAGGALPHLHQIQRSFGGHDVSKVVAHTDGNAAAGADAMGADAFATGDHVAFRGQPDLHTAAHEAAHVVQQRGGVQLKGGVGEVGDPYERHADEVADLVVQGKSSESLLSRHATPGASTIGGAAVQRHVFVGGKQVDKEDASAAPEGWVADDTVRSYKSRDELAQHAAGATDYLGNLPDGTWVRFNPKGLNVLGENHRLVRLDMVAPAVGSKSFIYERFSDDDLAEGSALKTAYDAENAHKFAQVGVEDEADKKQFGAESLFPKIGEALNAAIPYFEGARPFSELKKGAHIGNPLQRYLKLAWAHARDSKTSVLRKQAANQPVQPGLAQLVDVFIALEGTLDKVITSLPVEGWLGESLADPARAALLPLLARFAVAFTDAMVELATVDPTSRLDAARVKKYAAGGVSSEEKHKLFREWRDHRFEDSIKRAASSGVRYAGMGAAHLIHLEKVGLPANAHPFRMDSLDLMKFERETKRLASVASKRRQ